MFTKISVLVPTRGRAATRLPRLLETYAATSDPETSELVFRYDDDDDDTDAALWDAMESFDGDVDSHDGDDIYSAGYIRAIRRPRNNGYHSMPEFFNDALRISSGDVLMCGNDDMAFHTPGWAPMLLAEANRFPDGVFNLGMRRTFNWTHYPFSVVSRVVTDALGFVWDPRIFWGDMYLRDVMAELGRAVPVDGMHIDHEWIGHAPDKTHREGHAHERNDREYWDVVHKTCVRDAVERLRPLLRDAHATA